MDPNSSSPDRRPPADGLLLTRLLGSALRHRFLVLGLAFAASAFVIAGLFTKREWQSTSGFVTQSAGKLPGNLSGLAAQFGVSLPTGPDAAQSPSFYAEMLKARTLLEQLALSKFDYVGEHGRMRGDLYQIYETPGTGLGRRETMMQRLTKDVDVVFAPRTGIIRLSVTAPSPELAQAMNARLIELLVAFNTNVRRSQAGQERQYAQTQMEVARGQLREAEESLEAFQQGNASYNYSERLKLQAGRLQREVAHRQSIYSSLAQAYEQARLDEVRDTPAISVVEPPELPALPKPRRIAVRAPLAFILGGLVGLILAMLLELFRSLPQADPVGYAVARREWENALSGVRRRTVRAPRDPV
jgi:uncharacterized protein involved in exopolysaccharide biosynthesis